MTNKDIVRIIVLAMAGLLLASAALPATLCVNPSGAGGCTSTIQSAVFLAGIGDTVFVGPGTYFENVVIPSRKDGVQIVGAGKLVTIVDADKYADRGIANAGPAFAIDSRHVQVRNLTVRNGQTYGIEVRASDAVLQGLRITGPDAGGINIWSSAPNTQVVQNEIHNTPIGIATAAPGTVVRNNVVSDTFYGVNVGANGALVTGNRIWNFANYGILIPADGPVISLNEIRGSGYDGISTSGKYPVIRQNRVTGVSIGIVAYCTECFGGLVAFNTVTDTASYGILAFCDWDGLVIERNTLLRTGYGGLSVIGNGVLVKDNRVNDAGRDIFSRCFEGYGTRQRFTRNTATACAAAGFYVNGNDMTLDGNTAITPYENGFKIDGLAAPGNPVYANAWVEGNKSLSAAAQGIGIVNGAVNTVVTGNVAARNRTDFCDEGASTLAWENDFGTTAATCALSAPPPD